MITLVVHHRVRDYDAWKPVFDEHEGVRVSHGEVEHRIYRTSHRPEPRRRSTTTSSVEAARGFMADPSLPEAMERGGVEGEPGIGLPRVDRAEGATSRAATADPVILVHPPFRGRCRLEAGLRRARGRPSQPRRDSSTASSRTRSTPTASSSTSTSRPRQRHRGSRPIRRCRKRWPAAACRASRRPATRSSPSERCTATRLEREVQATLAWTPLRAKKSSFVWACTARPMFMD